MADAQESMSKMRERIRIIDEKHDDAVMDRGEVTLEYAVSHVGVVVSPFIEYIV